MQFELFASFPFCLLLPPFFFFFFFINCKSIFKDFFSASFLSIYANRNRHVQWSSGIVRNTPSRTFAAPAPLGRRHLVTANPSNVHHVLKTHFHVYPKGNLVRTTLSDLLGDGIFNADGESWKIQRQLSSHEFNNKSLRKFVETVVDAELSDRLLPILYSAASNRTVLDFQDILRRFTFDNICRIAFGYDPEYLSPSLPKAKFAVAFEQAVQIIGERYFTIHPLLWKIKRFLDVGSEKRLRIAVNEVREFSRRLIKEKKHELNQKTSLESVDLLSRFLMSSGHSDENFVLDMVICFILAGRDTTSAALAWFFWLLAGRPDVESEILREIREKSEEVKSVYDEVKDMVYTHASLSECMRLYPPLPVDTKEAAEDDVLPDGTVVKKGTWVSYHPYAMGRLEELWGKDWAEFRPERWLDRDVVAGKWSFVGRDPYVYPVFQAGPRTCLGKEMAFLQMKRVVAGVLRRFRVVPAAEKGVEPVFVSSITSSMKGGFPVRIEERVDSF